MAVQFSRRDFMKCTGLTACMVAAAGLFTGCGGNTTGHTVNTTVAMGGINVVMKGYKNLISIGNYSVVDVVFELTNTTESSVKISATLGDAVGNIIDKLLNGENISYSSLLSLSSSNFSVTASGGSVLGCADTSKQDDDIITHLATGKTGTVDLYAVVSGTWESLTIKYKPPFGSDTFLLTSSNKIA